MHFGVDKRESQVGLPTNAPGLTSGSLVHSYFKREVGEGVRAQLRLDKISHLPRPTSQAALNGTRYEKKVLALLTRTFPSRILPGPVFTFQEPNTRMHASAHVQAVQYGQKGKAIPDAILWSEDFRTVCVMEVKLRHTGDAWHQLHKFYLPIVRAALPWVRVCGLEICLQYDPSQVLPQPVSFVESAEAALETREAFHPVWILTARELRYDRGMV